MPRQRSRLLSMRAHGSTATEKHKMYVCSICNRYARRTLAGILRHIREVHPHFDGIVRCGVESCPSTTRSYESLRQHLYKKHKNILKQESPETPTHCQPAAGPRDVSPDITEDVDPTSLDHFMDEPFKSMVDQHPSLQAAQFILKTRDGRKITQAAVNDILQDTRAIVEYSIDVLKHKVVNKLESLEIMSSEEISSIQDLFSSSSLRNPFEGLETQYRQEKYFQEHFNYVVSVLYIEP